MGREEGRKRGREGGKEGNETHLAAGGGDLHGHAEVEEHGATDAVLHRDHQITRMGVRWERGRKGGTTDVRRRS